MSSSLKNMWMQLTEKILQSVAADEDLSLGLTGEESLFLRLNNGKLRQGTQVEQFTLEFQFQSQQRKVQYQASLGRDLQANVQLVESLLQRARDEVLALPLDPLVAKMENQGQSDYNFSGDFKGDSEGGLPDEATILNHLLECHQQDFSGFFCGGPLYRANRNSKGQNHWHATSCFFYDYSLFTVNPTGANGKPENKAVKGNYSDSSWNLNNLRQNIHEKASLLRLLERPSKKLAPGTYRAYLAPGAVNEILGTLSMGFGAGAYKQGRSPFAKLASGEERLSAKFSLRENFRLGFAPQFNSLGELAPEILEVVQEGQLKNWLVTSRTAMEYQLKANGAEINGWSPELMRSPEILPGQLKSSEALKQLGTGVWLGNLHYLNWSDLTEARVTGMTRYACFWVENGEIVAPIQDMRFDESIFRIFGSELLDLTVEQTLEPDISTYYRRELGARKFPGALVKEFRFTL